jgi:hypothetical protein
LLEEYFEENYFYADTDTDIDFLPNVSPAFQARKIRHSNRAIGHFARSTATMRLGLLIVFSIVARVLSARHCGADVADIEQQRDLRPA